jgi:hypothetical protein
MTSKRELLRQIADLRWRLGIEQDYWLRRNKELRDQRDHLGPSSY